MKTSKSYGGLFGIAAILIGFSAGYLVFDNSAEVQKLKSAISKFQREKVTLLSTNQQHLESNLSPTGQTIPPISASPKNANQADQIFTEEDVKIALAMNERESAGEYILKFERPTNRKSMMQGIKEFASTMASNKAPEWRRMFSQLGIKPEISEQLVTHRAKIQLASLEASTAMQQLLYARDEYDTRMRSLLSEEEYVQYRQQEDARKVAREYELLQDYARQSQTTIDPNQEAPISKLIQQAQAYTEKSCDGPYDGPPPDVVGKEKSLERLQQDISTLQKASAQIKAQATEMGLHEGYVNLLDAYYRQRLKELEIISERIRNL